MHVKGYKLFVKFDVDREVDVVFQGENGDDSLRVRSDVLQ